MRNSRHRRDHRSPIERRALPDELTYQAFYYQNALGGPAERLTTLDSIVWASAESESLGGARVAFFRNGYRYRIEKRRLTIDIDEGII